MTDTQSRYYAVVEPTINDVGYITFRAEVYRRQPNPGLDLLAGDTWIGDIKDPDREFLEAEVRKIVAQLDSLPDSEVIE